MDPLKFKLEKSTKNTYRYQEEPADGKPFVVGTLYVQKWALKNPAPEELTLTIEE